MAEYINPVRELLEYLKEKLGQDLCVIQNQDSSKNSNVGLNGNSVDVSTLTFKYYVMLDKKDTIEVKQIDGEVVAYFVNYSIGVKCGDIFKDGVDVSIFGKGIAGLEVSGHFLKAFPVANSFYIFRVGGQYQSNGTIMGEFSALTSIGVSFNGEEYEFIKEII